MGYDFFKKPIYPKNIRYSENETYYIDCGCGEIARKQYKKIFIYVQHVANPTQLGIISTIEPLII